MLTLNEPMLEKEPAVPLKEIADRTNSLLTESAITLAAIMRMLEGDCDAPSSPPEIQSFRDALTVNNLWAENIMARVHDIANILGL